MSEDCDETEARNAVAAQIEEAYHLSEDCDEMEILLSSFFLLKRLTI